jgi:CRISPR system Cascade subunit CasC
MFVELHILQNFAPSNLNRDDTNSPKDCSFGGVRRARISSQCLKRAMRNTPIFKATTQVENGVRTRWVGRLIQDALVNAGKAVDEAALVANGFAAAYAGKADKPGKDGLSHTSMLVYYSPEEIREISLGVLNNWETALAACASPDDRKLQEASPLPGLVADMVKRSKGRTSAPDIALFGRMLANDPTLNMDAAVQVAHAISTHRVDMEFDFYTAVDDLSREEESGAGMMGVTGFNSACFYRYAHLDWEQLFRNLDGDRDLAYCTAEGFLRAAIEAVPTGKQNTFAAHNPPSFILAVVRQQGMGWSLANAFEKPIVAGREGGYVSRSAAALDAYWSSLDSVYGSVETKVYALPLEEGLPLEHLAVAKVSNFNTLVVAVLSDLKG